MFKLGLKACYNKVKCTSAAVDEDDEAWAITVSEPPDADAAASLLPVGFILPTVLAENVHKCDAQSRLPIDN